MTGVLRVAPLDYADGGVECITAVTSEIAPPIYGHRAAGMERSHLAAAHRAIGGHVWCG